MTAAVDGEQGRATYTSATVALAVLTLASSLGFARVYTTGRWVAPVVVMVILIHLAGWLMRRLRLPAGASPPVLLALTALAAIYLVFPHYLSYGLPLVRAWKALDRALLHAGQGINTMVTPVPALPGFAVLSAWGAGIAATGGEWFAFRVKSPMGGVVPALALFITCCALGTPAGRVPAVVVEVAAMVGFVIVHQLTVGQQRLTWFGGRRAGTYHWAITVGTGLGLLALLPAVVMTPVLPRTEGSGVLGWKVGASSSGNRITPSPLDQLRTRLLQETNTPVMTVRASVPSYWRLTSLDYFTGSSWEADHSYKSFRVNLPGVVIPTTGTREVIDKFHIQNLDSIWLPSAFDPVEVVGGNHVTWDPVSGSLISRQPTSNGENYEVIALQQLASLSPARLAAAPAAPQSILHTYVQLPSLPPNITELARSITASAKTEYAKALALEQFFHQPSFVYSTDPPSNDSTNALEYFLFQSRTGYCQQFAGAYAVLARSIGIPTRVAVGFQEGTKTASGVYQVTDADAHAWPEVYFSGIGWVPFEPTPGRQVPGAKAYTGQTDVVGTPSAVTPTTVAPGPSAATTFPLRTRLPAPALSQASKKASHAGKAAGLGAWAWAVLSILFAAILVGAWMGAVTGLRRERWRRRRRRAATGQSEDRVLAAWDELAETLAWWRMQRRPYETVGEYSLRIQRQLRGVLGRTGGDAEVFAELAAMTEVAGFALHATGPQDAARAPELARRLEAKLRKAAPARRRVARLVDPRYALGRLAGV